MSVTKSANSNNYNPEKDIQSVVSMDHDDASNRYIDNDNESNFQNEKVDNEYQEEPTFAPLFSSNIQKSTNQRKQSTESLSLLNNGNKRSKKSDNHHEVFSGEKSGEEIGLDCGDEDLPEEEIEKLETEERKQHEYLSHCKRIFGLKLGDLVRLYNDCNGCRDQFLNTLCIKTISKAIIRD